MTLKASNPDSTYYFYRGKRYTIHDAYPTLKMANQYAKDLRTTAGRTYPSSMTKAIVVDLGPEAGRLRYAIFVAQGRPVGRRRYS